MLQFDRKEKWLRSLHKSHRKISSHFASTVEYFKLDNDIHVYCVKADSFPAGINAAQEKFTAISKPVGKRNHFGISFLYDDKISYMAAAELKSRENVPAGCETYTLRKGNYISIYVADFMKDTQRLGVLLRPYLMTLALMKMGVVPNVIFEIAQIIKLPLMFVVWLNLLTSFPS